MSERKFKEMYLTGIFETYLGDQVRDNAGKAWDGWLNSVKAEAWDEGHEAPCDKWIRSEMCREYHPNPYRTGEE